MLLTLLPPALHERVVAGARHAGDGMGVRALDATQPWEALERSSAGSLLVLDPRLLSSDGAELARLVRVQAERGFGCVFYTEFQPPAMHAVAFAAALRPRALWLAGIDDRPQALAAGWSRLMASELAQQLLTMLEPRLETLPVSLREACRAVVLAPARFFDAGDVARVAAMSRRNVDRVLQRGGLTTAALLVVAARVAHGAAVLRTSRLSIAEVAQSLGYSDEGVFARHVQRVLGRRPAELRHLEPEPCVRALVRFVLVGDAPPPLALPPAPGLSMEAGQQLH